MNSISKKIPLFKVGDRYIHFTKHGGINTGVVRNVRALTTLHLTQNEKYMFDKWYIINEVGISLELDGTDGQIYKLQNI